MNNNRVAKFEKVCFSQYERAVENITLRNISHEEMLENYHSINLPKRSTKGSAGYDFYADRDYVIQNGESAVITTGIACQMDDNYVLMLFPRSGLGFKTSMRLANTVGIIDSDFVNGETCGHILVKMINHDSDAPVIIKRGERFCQGVLLPFGITVDDDIDDDRAGGIGSTGK